MPDHEQGRDTTGIGDRLRFIRNNHPDGRMTVAQLAEKSGVSKRFITEVESGNANPTVNNLEKITQAVGIARVAYLLDADVFDQVNAEKGLPRGPGADRAQSSRSSPEGDASPGSQGRTGMLMRRVAGMDDKTFKLLEGLVDAVTAKQNAEGT